MRVGELLEAVYDRLEQAGLAYGHGMEGPLDEAAHLIAQVLFDAPTLNEAQLNEVVNEASVDQLEQIVNQRIRARIPAAYLTGEAWFAGVRFEVDPRVIVPRSPIAELLAEQLAPWVQPERVGSVLDLCCGSGCIALVAAMVFPQAAVVATDLSADALAVARHNLNRFEASGELREGQVRLIQSDLFTALNGQRFDVIISNPPYVPRERELPEEYLHEPEMALYAGADGLDLALPILLQAADHLTESGVLLLEVGEAADALMELLPEFPAIWLEFESGGEGVLLISREELLPWKAPLEETLALRVARNR